MENQKKIKTLGKVLSILATIAKICIYIGVSFLILFAFMVPIIFSKVDIRKNRVAIVGIPDARVEIYKDDSKELNVVINDKKIDLNKELSHTEKLSAEEIFDMLSDTTKEAVVVYLEGSIILGIVSMILISISLKNFAKFGNNLNTKDEVFAKDNSIYLHKTAKFLLISYIITIVSSTATDGFLTDHFNFDINGLGIVEIIVLYTLSYIF